MQHRHAIVLAAAAALLGGLAPAARADDLDDIKQKGVIVMGIKADYKPFGFRQPDGSIVGLEIELAEDLAKRLGVKTEMVPTTAANRMQFLEQKRIDVILAAMNITDERRKIVFIVEPGYYASGANLLAPKAFKVKDWADLKGQKICGVQGAYYNKPVQERYGADILAYKTTAETQEAFRAGYCAGFVYDDVYLLNRLEEPEWKDYSMALTRILEEPMGAAVRLGQQRLHDAVEAAVIDWHRSGRLVELEKKWVGQRTKFIADMNEKYKRQAAAK